MEDKLIMLMTELDVSRKRGSTVGIILKELLEEVWMLKKKVNDLEKNKYKNIHGE